MSAFNRDKVRSDLKAVILQYCDQNGINPMDGTRLIMNSTEIWRALIVSGKMPRSLSYSDMMNGIHEAIARRKGAGQ